MTSLEYTTPKPALCTLPVECKEAILCFLPNLDALKATILTHSSLYSVYAGRQSFILRQVTSNHILPDLLPEAVLALSASRFNSERWKKEKIFPILQEHRARTIPPSFQWNVSNVAKLYSFHGHVEFMTAHFLQSAMSNNPALLNQPLSPEEWIRVARSFYHFEIFRHLFTERCTVQNLAFDIFLPEERWDIYYKDFAVWELEQLVCVSEHLFRTIVSPFNEVAAHDVKWGYEGIAYPLVEAWDYELASHVSHVLFQGLAFLRKVITASTYDDRRRLLTPVVLQIVNFLPSEARELVCRKVDDAVPLSQYDQAQLEPFVQPYAPEPDLGPVEAWVRAHLEAPWRNFVADINSRDLRRWGYVMWDHSRLQSIGFLDNPFVPPPRPEIVSETDRLDAVIDSLITRRKLFVNGARGWWAKDDESHLEWVKPWELSDEEEDIDLLMDIVSL